MNYFRQRYASPPPQQKQPGLFRQMAATAAGVAVGSTVVSKYFMDLIFQYQLTN